MSQKKIAAVLATLEKIANKSELNDDDRKFVGTVRDTVNEKIPAGPYKTTVLAILNEIMAGDYGSLDRNIIIPEA